MNAPALPLSALENAAEFLPRHIGIDAADVAGAEPAVGGEAGLRRRVVAQVGMEQAQAADAAHQQLAGTTGLDGAGLGHRALVVVDDGDAVLRRRPADGQGGGWASRGC